MWKFAVCHMQTLSCCLHFLTDYSIMQWEQTSGATPCHAKHHNLYTRLPLSITSENCLTGDIFHLFSSLVRVFCMVSCLQPAWQWLSRGHRLVPRFHDVWQMGTRPIKCWKFEVPFKWACSSGFDGSSADQPMLPISVHLFNSQPWGPANMDKPFSEKSCCIVLKYECMCSSKILAS